MSLSQEQVLLRGNDDRIHFDKHLQLCNLVCILVSYSYLVGVSLEHTSWGTIITDFTCTLMLISVIFIDT